MGWATQLALRAGTHGTHIAFVIPTFYILSLTGQHRLKDAEGVRDPSVESRLLPQEHIWATAWGACGKRGGLCPYGWAVLVAAAHSQLLGTACSDGLQQEMGVSHDRACGSSPCAAVDNSTAPSWQTMDSCWKIFVDTEKVINTNLLKYTL